MSNVPSVSLSNGVSFPAIGLGTFVGPVGGDHQEIKQFVLDAIKIGYRHIDTALLYRTERAIGEAIRESGIPREEFFVVTKLWNHHHKPEHVARGLDISLRNLNLDYVDLYLMHWPMCYEYLGDEEYYPQHEDGSYKLDRTCSYVDTWKAMEALPKSKARAIGVSNFSPKTFDVLLKEAKVVPLVNQVEVHPFNQQHELHAYCKERGIVLTAYSPLGQGDTSVLKDTTIQRLAGKHECTPAQVILSWIAQIGDSVIVKSSKMDRLAQNFKLVSLDDQDLTDIKKLERNKRLARRAGADMTQPVFGWSREELGWS